MNQKQVTARLKELDRSHGRFPLWMKMLVADLLAETSRLGLPDPSLISAEADGCLHVVWQGAEGRATVYTDDDLYTIEVVPRGPLVPFSAGQVSEAGAYLAGLFINFGPLGSEEGSQ